MPSQTQDRRPFAAFREQKAVAAGLNWGRNDAVRVAIGASRVQFAS